MKYLLTIIALFFWQQNYSQPIQTNRYELEEKNNDDYVNILPVDDEGIILFRDTKDYDDGDLWNLIALDTALMEKWNIELAIDSRYVFKAYEVVDSKLFLLFRKGEYEKKDYHLMVITFKDASIERYDIENEISLELSHMSVLSTGLVLAGYINFSPALVLYPFGAKSFEVVPGYFKDRSTIVDLRDNGNSTFNAITLENDYEGNYLRLRTYSNDGELLFEREIKTKENTKILTAKSSGFTDGNLVIGGTYGLKKSSYASGYYVCVVKPEGQDNIFKYHNFYELNHFFDYMNPKRAERLRNKMESKSLKGKEVNFTTRILFNGVQSTENGYLFLSELYNPNYTNSSFMNNGFLTRDDELRRRALASQNYARQPSRLQNVQGADSFEYKETILFEVNKTGDLLWDNSMKIEDLEKRELTQVVQVSERNQSISMLYKGEDELHYKIIQGSEVIEENNIKPATDDEFDKILNTVKGIGETFFWYESYFIVWGYQKIENKVRAAKEEIEKNRYVLYVDKINVL